MVCCWVVLSPNALSLHLGFGTGVDVEPRRDSGLLKNGTPAVLGLGLSTRVGPIVITSSHLTTYIWWYMMLYDVIWCYMYGYHKPYRFDLVWSNCFYLWGAHYPHDQTPWPQHSCFMSSHHAVHSLADSAGYPMAGGDLPLGKTMIKHGKLGYINDKSRINGHLDWKVICKF